MNDKALRHERTDGSSVTKKNIVLEVVGNLLFYGFLVLLVFAAVNIRRGKSNQPWLINGYSAMIVLTGSMQDVYPQGSLIITKAVDPDQLEIGDDITFMTSETSSITHRIIDITENYMETGKRGFKTKGIMNTYADDGIAAADNVVGKVIFCSLPLGTIANFITANWPLLMFYLLVLVALTKFLQWNAQKKTGK